MMKMNLHKLKWTLFTLVLGVILILLVFKLVFDIAPTSATVENFLKENSCTPATTETDFNEEHFCAYYLRRHTATIFGQIINAGFPLFVTNPFGYFNYDPTPPTPDDFGCALTNSCKEDEHMYVLVVTRDKGPLVYNPVNGKYIGSYNALMSNMGCDFQVKGNSTFSSQTHKAKLYTESARCDLEKMKKMLEELKLKEKLK